MAVIGAVLAAMTPTLKAMALQTALNVGVDQASKYIGQDNAGVVGQAVEAFAGGDIDGLVDIGTNFATEQINNFANNPQLGQVGQIASQGLQQVMGAGQGNYGQALQSFGVDQATQYLNQLMGKVDLSQFPNLQRLSQSPEGQTMMSQAFGAMQQGGMLQGATQPPAHQDPNMNSERAWLPPHDSKFSSEVFGRPAPAPSAYRQENSPLINKGRYQVQ